MKTPPDYINLDQNLSSSLFDDKPMKHKINPQIDCVFKALLGSPEGVDRLINFLNSILLPKYPITGVEIANPYNPQEFVGDKQSIVDIKATDSNKITYQIELQLCNNTSLAHRMVYNWSAIYKAQLTEGLTYEKLNPVISIWLVVDKLFKDSPNHHHHFELYDKNNHYSLTNHCAIHVLELAKWHKQDTLSEADSWLYFFKDAKDWNTLPSELNTPVMRSAMKTLKQFSEKQLEYFKYEARQGFIREQMSLQHDYDEAHSKLEEAKQQREQAVQQREQAELKLEQERQEFEQKLEQEKKSSKEEIEALQAKLRAAGLI